MGRFGVSDFPCGTDASILGLEPYVPISEAANKLVRGFFETNPGTLQRLERYRRFSLDMPRGIKPRGRDADLNRISAQGKCFFSTQCSP